MKKNNSPHMEKFCHSVEKLRHSLSFEKKISADEFYFDGISKAFEMSLEYAWKYFKFTATEHGLEVFSPREAIKAAGQLKLIGDVELWLGFLEDRNYAVHDYMGIQPHDYLETIKKYYQEAQKVVEGA